MQQTPDHTKQKLREILEEAIEQERRSQQRYSMGASVAVDPEVKQMFLRLLEDEMDHERRLRERLLSLTQGKKA